MVIQIDMDQIIRDLETAVEQERAEAGDCWSGLCHMWRVAHYGCNHKFINALEQEIRDQHAYLIDNFTWVDNEEIKCDKCGKSRSAYRMLVWNGDLE